jgi:hypothetical protein
LIEFLDADTQGILKPKAALPVDYLRADVRCTAQLFYETVPNQVVNVGGLRPLVNLGKFRLVNLKVAPIPIGERLVDYRIVGTESGLSLFPRD